MGTESKKPRSVWERLEHMDPRISYWLLIFVIVVPFLRPLGLPISISKETQSFYNTLDALRPGSVVLFDISSGPAAYGEIGPGSIAMMEYVTVVYPGRHEGGRLRIAIVSGGEAEGAIMYEAYARPRLEKAGFQYGADYAWFGFIAGGETMVARLADSIPSLLRNDFFGTTIDKLPVMKGVSNYKDVSVVIVWDSVDATAWYVRHWGAKGVRVGTVCVAVEIPAYITFYRSGEVFGIIGSSRGGAELELLVGKPGVGVATTDTLSTSHLLVIILIIVVHIGLLARKYLPSTGKR